MKRCHLLFAFLFLFAASSFGQNKYGSGEDSVQCIKELNLYRGFRKSKDFKKAIPHWQKAVELCPKASKKIYIDGAKFYKAFIGKAKSKDQKRAYIDSLMWVYDKRIKEFGEEAKVTGFKGSQLVKYRKFLADSMLVKGNEYLSRSVHALKKQAFPPHVARYFTSLYFLYQKDSVLAEEDKVKEKEIISEYLPISKYVDQNIKNPRGKKYKRFFKKKVKPTVDKIFMGVVECEDLKKQYGARVEKDSAVNPRTKEQMMLAMKQRGCDDNELYPKLAKMVHKQDPSPSSAYEIGILEMKKDNNEEAAKFLDEAIKLMKKDSANVDQERLQEFYIAAGRNANERGMSSKANEYARKALKIDKEEARAYVVIAEAIANSASACSGDKIKGGVYWLAADYIQKAEKKVEKGDTTLQELVNDRMGRYRANFPGKDAMFTAGWLKDNGEPVDKPYKVGCWIGESTRPRKSW
ncbi:MAG: tetratricopeptide repeat protein [Flavobacteriales bacterium]